MDKQMTIRRKLSIILTVAVFLAAWTLYSWLPAVERISIDSPKVGPGKVRIALITDLHSCWYGREQGQIFSKIEREKPDIAVLSGDIFDDKIPDENAKILLERLAEICPCFYVTGNHELWSGRVREMKDYVQSIGVTVLSGNCRSINVNGAEIDVCGVDDPFYMEESEWKKQIDSAFSKTSESHLKILASHRPERTKIYGQYDFDLILAGHAHAGQIRIPFLNRGLYAPDQGFFAKYVNGPYKQPNGSVLVVSRGLARESTPLPRFFNRPEIAIIEVE